MSHRSHSRSRVRGQQGFTLVEQIVTIAIMAMVLVAGIAALSTGALGLTVTVSRNQAMNLAQEQLECIKGAEYNNGGYNVSGPCKDRLDDSGYAITTTATGVVPIKNQDPSIWPKCDPNCNAQLIQVSISRGGNSILEIEDLKLNRPVDLAAFAREGLHDPELRAMMGCIEVALDARAEAAFPALRAARVAVTMRDGRVRSHRQPTRRGDPDLPLSDEEIGAKFHMLADPVIGAAAAAKIAGALWRICELKSVARIPAPGRAG